MREGEERKGVDGEGFRGEPFMLPMHAIVVPVLTTYTFVFSKVTSNDKTIKENIGGNWPAVKTYKLIGQSCFRSGGYQALARCSRFKGVRNQGTFI